MNEFGCRPIVGATTPLMAAHKVVRRCYTAIANGKPDPLLGSEGRRERGTGHRTIKFAAMLDVEPRTIER